jgi:hypothetical protein
MNRSRFELQRRAVTRADASIRGKLLGRALYTVRNNPTLFYEFLTDNVTAFAGSDEDPIVPLSGKKRKTHP